MDGDLSPSGSSVVIIEDPSDCQGSFKKKSKAPMIEKPPLGRDNVSDDELIPHHQPPLQQPTISIASSPANKNEDTGKFNQIEDSPEGEAMDTGADPAPATPAPPSNVQNAAANLKAMDYERKVVSQASKNFPSGQGNDAYHHHNLYTPHAQ